MTTTHHTNSPDGSGHEHSADAQTVSLEEQIRAALDTPGAENDVKLAQRLIDAGVITRVLEEATVSDAEARQMLDYSPDSFRATINQTISFPGPVVVARRWSVADLQQYRQQHRRRHH